MKTDKITPEQHVIEIIPNTSIGTDYQTIGHLRSMLNLGQYHVTTMVYT